MSDERAMIPSEAITAGAIRQSMDNGERCPECGAPLDCVYPPVDHPIRKYRCGTSTKDGKVAQSHKCMLNQLAISRECERAALAREAQLWRVVKRVEWVEPPDAHPGLGRWCPTCRAWESDGHEIHCPYYGGQVNGILAAALRESPATTPDTSVSHLQALQTGDGVRMTNYTSEGQARRPRAYGEATHAFGGGGRE